MVEMVKNCPKPLNMVGSNGKKSPKPVNYGQKIIKYAPKWSKITQNSQL